MEEKDLITICNSLMDYAKDKDIAEISVSEFKTITGYDFSAEYVYELSGITVKPEGGNIFSMISMFEMVHFNADENLFTYSVNGEMYSMDAYDVIL